MITTAKLQNAVQAARYLLGKQLVHIINGKRVGGIIVEVEAYAQDDPAAHTYKGETARTKAMFGPAGHAYVYRSYGLHWCMNVTTGLVGSGEAVLIRALEPVEGLEVMQKLRGKHVPHGQLTNGPGKLAQALHITNELYGHDLTTQPLFIEDRPSVSDSQIVVAPRIGISQNAEALLRFYIRGNHFVSK